MKPFFSFIIISLGCLSVIRGQGNLQYRDWVYDDFIKTVQLYPNSPQPAAQMASPVISLNGRQQLLLEFDELFNDAYNYRAKIIHCNANWQPSDLSPLQYLQEYNEYEIDDMDYSFGTLTPYVHYKFILPRPTLPGNYLLVVYAADNEDDIIISRRFMVYEQRLAFTDKYEIIRRAPYSLTQQQLQFEINYQGMELLNPMDYVSVNILQNQRWDNAKLNLKPTAIREAQHILEYNHFTNENAFDAGNEFRYFDIRSLKYFGFHVRTARFQKDKIFAWLETDKPRAGLAYSIEQNNMGQFYIENIERKIPDIENDYARVTFTLAAEQYAEDVFISGRFTDWRKDSSTRMQYNKTTGVYEATYILKQGNYDYQYVLASPKTANNIEGNKRETRNLYEIFVYYRSPKLQADILIGYYKFVYALN